MQSCDRRLALCITACLGVHFARRMRVGAVIDAVNDEHISTKSAQQPLIISYRRKSYVAYLPRFIVVCPIVDLSLARRVGFRIAELGGVGTAVEHQRNNAFSFVGARWLCKCFGGS